MQVHKVQNVYTGQTFRVCKAHDHSRYTGDTQTLEGSREGACYFDTVSPCGDAPSNEPVPFDMQARRIEARLVYAERDLALARSLHRMADKAVMDYIKQDYIDTNHETHLWHVSFFAHQVWQDLTLQVERLEREKQALAGRQ